tara:strand:- start:35 stop:1915 length:1881 start_codon:yes stop_codon:yes gene_type:complete
MGASASIAIQTGNSITRLTSPSDKIIFNNGNLTFGSVGIFNNSIQVKSTDTNNSGNVSFFEASANGTNNIDLHCPETTTHDYNAYLPKITNTGISSVYILSNQNVLAGTNVSISGTETITINSTDTNTEYTAGTNISLSGTTFNLDTTLVGNLTWTGSQTYENVLEITGPASSLGYINLYSNDNNKISLKTNVNIGSSYDIILPSSTGTLALTTQIPNLSFASPLQISSNTVSLGGLSSYGSTNQIIATSNDGSNNLQYRTLTQGTNITISHTSSAITISSSENYWERDSNISSFDIKTNSTVDSIALTVPFSTSSTLKTTGGLISGSSDYLKWVVYETNYRALEQFCAVPSAPATQQSVHFLLKNGEADFSSIRQNTAGSLFIHFENNGDCFEVNKNFEYGHKGAKWKYTDPRTYLYNVEDTNGASTLAGSILHYPKDGSTVNFNTTNTYLSGNTNYYSFAKSNDQQARITMDGNAQIAVAWLDSNDPSDRRIKYDIQDYQNATSVIDKIKIKSFMKYQLKNFNNDVDGKMLPFTDRLGEAKYSIGVIAQEIADIPELAFMVEGSFEDTINPAYIHNYIPIISLLVKSNQEQQQTINELKTLVQNQQLVINNLLSATTFSNFKKM